MNRLFCFGMGFSARALASRAREQGWTVAGTSRNPSPTEADTLYPFEGPLSDPSVALDRATHLLISIPPVTAGDLILRHHAHDLLVHAPMIEWVGYLSTTGVYGDRQGNWVDETTPVNPSTDRAKRRVAAEVQWQNWGRDNKRPVQIFRLAGIYGPGRNQLVSVMNGTARCVVKPGQVFSRIHVEDIAQVLWRSIEKPRAGGIYNVCDDDPAAPHEVVQFAAQILGRSPPSLESYDEAAPSLSEMSKSFFSESKRVSNSLIKSELGVELRYPSFRSGLSALLAEMGDSNTIHS